MRLAKIGFYSVFSGLTVKYMIHLHKTLTNINIMKRISYKQIRFIIRLNLFSRELEFIWLYVTLIDWEMCKIRSSMMANKRNCTRVVLLNYYKKYSISLLVRPIERLNLSTRTELLHLFKYIIYYMYIKIFL